MPDASSQLGLYRTGLTSPEHRRYITVARSSLVQDTIETLRSNSAKKSKHHFLFIGPRGIGKTHLLSLIEDEINSDEKLGSQYVIARFPEESHRILSFADLLLGICKILSDELPDEPVWEELFDRVSTEEDDSVIVDTLVPVLRQQNRSHKRTVLVMLENLNEIFTNQIKKPRDIASLRKFFNDDNRCLLIATAPLHFDSVTDVEQPFYDFFDTQILDSLSESETLDLIRQNLEWEKRHELLEKFPSMKPKLLALYRMTGGNPRLVAMLYELIAHDSVTAIQQQLHKLLDRITPFYQDRMRDLPAQERALLETMATMRDQEKTPAAIAKRMRQSAQQTSSLLKRLSQSRYLRSSAKPSDKRSRLYTIREGFFDIWLAMNLSRSSQKRLPFLLDFFNLFYSNIEAREQKRAELRQQLNTSTDSDIEQTLDYLSEVGSTQEKGDAKLNLAKHFARNEDTVQTQKYLREAAPLVFDSASTWIVRHADEKASHNYLDEIQEMIDCWEMHRSGDLEKFSARLLDLGDTLTYRNFSETKLGFLQDSLHQIVKPEQRILLKQKIAKILYDLARWKEAEPLLDSALLDAEQHQYPNLTSAALNNLAQLLKATNRLEEAEPLMRRALKINETFFGDQHPNVAALLNNLAQLLKATNRLEEAEPLMRRALQIDEASFGDQHPDVAIDLNNLAQLLQATNRLEEAEPLMRRALQILNDSLGEEHPNSQTVAKNLEVLLGEMDASI